MKKSLFNLMYVTAFALICFSCAKEQVAPKEIAPDTQKIAEDFLVTTPVILLFASLEIDHKSNMINGFVIDKMGDLRSLKLAKNHYVEFRDGYISDHAMRDLRDQSKVVKRLSAEELANFYKKSSTVKLTPELAMSDEEARYTSVQLKFQRNFDHSLPASCGPGNYDHGPTAYQVTLTAKGKYDFTNSATVTEEVSDWLIAYDAEAENN